MLFESARCLKNLQGNLKVYLCLNFCKIIDEAIVEIFIIAQVISKTFEVFFMFNFYKKLDKEVVRIRTMTQKPFRKLRSCGYGKNSNSIVYDKSTDSHKAFLNSIRK